MENENTRHRHTRQSLWVDIGEEEGVELLADTDENDETAREQKSEIKLVFRCLMHVIKRNGTRLEKLLRFFYGLPTSRVHP